MSKLLHKPLKLFSLYALLVLVSSIPVYYLIIDRIWIDELDEHNTIIAEHAREKLSTLKLTDRELPAFLNLWSTVQSGTALSPYTGTERFQDSAYTLIRKSEYGKKEEKDRFRGLKTLVSVNRRSYILTVETNIEESKETIVAIALITFVFFVILIVGFLLLNKKVAVKIWSPFQDTLSKLQSFDLGGQEPVDLVESDIEEFKKMNDVLRRLIDRNLATFTTQKKFTENASHELQTPLAIMQSKLDLLQQESNLSSRQHQLIRDLHIAISRTARINKNLLMLAKIDNRQFQDTEDVHVSELVTELMELLSEHIAGKGIKVDGSISENVHRNGSKVLMEVLFQNLLFNAYRHNKPNGEILIRLNEQGLVIANTGTESLDTDGLFKRFSSVSGTGTGLGLAIIREICTTLHWYVHYNFENSKHYFHITFTNTEFPQN